MITLLLDDGWSILEGRPSTSPGKTCEPSNLCYYLFTSGSTGQPKGELVMLLPIALMAPVVGLHINLSIEHTLA